MTQFAIPNADPVATLTFEDVVTVDVSTFTGTGDYISLSLPEFAKTKFTLASTFIDFTSNEKGNFGLGPTDEIPFSQGTFVNTQINNDTELRIPISKLIKVDKTAITGVRFRLFATESTTFRCLSIRACAESWKYAPIDFDTLWHRVHRPPSPNAALSNRTNLVTNPSFETGTSGWLLSSGSFVEASKVQAEAPASLLEPSNLWACHIEGKKDATTTQRFLILETKEHTEAFPVNASKTYTVSGYLYFVDPPTNAASSKHPNNLFVEITWYNLEGAEISLTSTGYTIGKEELRRLSHTETAPVGAAFAKVRFACWTDTLGDKIDGYLDKVMLEVGSEAKLYFDGNYQGGSWTGTANASTSVAVNSSFPSESGALWPITFRSNAFQGLSDPEPINLTVGAVFNAGSYGQASGSLKNEIALYFRDVPTDNQTMIEMDTRSMASLDAANKQPDFGKALFDARDQEEIDLYDQVELDERTQYTIERKRDESEHTWMECRLKWGAETASNELTLHDADGLGYKWTGMALEASKATELDKGRYILLVQIKDTWMRAKIYQLNQVGSFISETPVFDTGKITDENLIKRRKGRFGWFASLLDGDAHIDNIKTRGTNFGEVISKPFRSITPVKGVQLFTGSTSDKELIEGFERTQPEWMTLSLDPNASSGGKAIKVVTTPLKPLQGISSNTFQIDEPSNIRISLDLKFPSSEIPGGQLIGFLLGSNETIAPIHFSPYMYGQWSHIKVQMPEGLYQTGGYKVVIMQTLPVVATTWWIENLSAQTYSVKWSARPKPSDAWGLNGPRWREAGFTLNSLNGGIVFPEHGNELQIRAQALRQDAVISDFKAIPQYATLGRIIFGN
jgi:hypothetical protein